MKVKVVLLDFDGTLVDMSFMGAYLRDMRKRVVKLCIYSGIHPRITVKYSDPYELFISMYRDPIFTESLGDGVSSLIHRVSSIIEEYEEKVIPYTKCMPSCVEFLKELKDLGVETCIVTLQSLKVTKVILRKEGLLNYIDAIYARDSPGKPKPFKDHVIACLNEFNADENSAVIVGDTLIDLWAAIEAGVPFIGISTGLLLKEELLEAGASMVVEGLSELLPLLKNSGSYQFM
ncbi:MAG: HAD family hydrolase [Sulfolobales archaeon]|nr:HAD family hydrolase [Sulfolobales archaeon]